MKEIKVYRSPLKAILLTLGSILFVVVGLWIASDPKVDKFIVAMGWIGAGFFTLGIVAGLYSIFDKRPQIILNTTGVFDRTIYKGFIPWDVIMDAYPFNIRGAKFISLVVKDEFEEAARKDMRNKSTISLNKKMGAQAFNLNLAQVKVDQQKFIALIHTMRNASPEERKAVFEKVETAL